MALTFSTALRTARVQAIETEAGVSAIIKIRTGAPPATVATASTGTVLATVTLPSDWATTANGVLTKSGTWQDLAADSAGTAGHYELVKSDGTTVVLRGTVTATGGGGDMTVDNTVFAANQQFDITAFTITDGNA